MLHGPPGKTIDIENYNSRSIIEPNILIYANDKCKLLTIGCGKTMIAQATAGEAHARFINLDVSLLTDKW